ncbi:MAG TPA: copper chaperone [Gammaproteobacteria bacterium]|nr:copper chaperone [Gammaproteobacteria bacterium]
MKQWIPILLLAWSAAALAAGSHYVIRVDGLACPYCAYGVEKKLKAIDGVESIDVDLNKGVVTVDTAEGTVLTEDQLRTLFQDAGFTYRSMKATER